MIKHRTLLLYFLSQFILTVIVVLTCLFYKQDGLIDSYLWGSGLISINFFLLYWLWQIILFKKFIALALILIVFKYALLGLFIFKILNETWINPLAFSMGLLTLVPSLASLIFYKKINWL